MRHTVWKAFTIWQFEEEIVWLNAMAAKGLNLVYPGFFYYVFEDGNAGEYQYTCECLEHYPNHPESLTYIRFMEESGVEYMGSLKKWVYFRRKTSDDTFQLGHDLDSRIKHYRYSQKMTIFFSILLLAVALWNFLNYLDHEPVVALICSILCTLVAIWMIGGTIKSFIAYRRWQNERLLRE